MATSKIRGDGLAHWVHNIGTEPQVLVLDSQVPDIDSVTYKSLLTSFFIS